MLVDSHIDRDRSGFEKLSADLTKRAQVVAKELITRVAETEKARRLPVENMERICDEGLLRVIQSRRCGGHELSMRVHLDVLSAIAEGCSATAWVLGVCMLTAGCWHIFRSRLRMMYMEKIQIR